jgi:hypothetical protein
MAYFDARIAAGRPTSQVDADNQAPFFTPDLAGDAGRG